jgi:hypothetical protein
MLVIWILFLTMQLVSECDIRIFVHNKLVCKFWWLQRLHEWVRSRILKYFVHDYRCSGLIKVQFSSVCTNLMLWFFILLTIFTTGETIRPEVIHWQTAGSWMYVPLRSSASYILDLGIRWRGVIIFTPQIMCIWYPLHWLCDGFKSWSGHLREKSKTCTWSKMISQSPSLVTMLSELS